MKHRLHVQKKASSTSKFPANRFQSRPFAPPTEASPPQQMPDLQTQRENAERLGYNFANIPILRPNSSPPPIQPKLTIGQPGDKYEQEADAVARQVVSQMNSPQTVQRQEMPEEDEEELQMKSDSGTIQREEMPEEDEEELQMKPESGTIQREEMPEEDEEELQMKPMVQPQAEGGMAATPDLEASIQQARGGGQPLSDNIREPMEQAFGADFGGVRVHTDATSDELNQSIQAKAFTTGQDVFFRQGAYQPGSQGGQELIAHELTHVVQQRASKIQCKRKTDTEEEHRSIKISAISNNAIQRVPEKNLDRAIKRKNKVLHYYKKYLEGILAKENCEFLEDVNEYFKNPNNMKIAKKIFHKYELDNVGRVNIGGTARDKLHEAFTNGRSDKGKLQPGLVYLGYKAVYNEVLNANKTSTWQNFMNSQEWQDYISTNP